MVANAVDRRRDDRTSALTAEEGKVVADRIRGVLMNLAELRFMLATAVERWGRRGGSSHPERNRRLAAISPRRCTLMPSRRAGVEIVFRECEEFCLSGSRLVRMAHRVDAQLLILCSRMHAKDAYETPKACGVSRWGNTVVVVKMRKTTVCPCTGLAGVANRVVQVRICLLYDHISPPRPRHPPAVLP